MRLIFLGPPGVGKGTQALKLSDACKIPKISTGDILREAVRNNTPLGMKAKSFIDAGRLVPDDLVVSLIHERLKEDNAQKGYIMDGFPRNVVQAEALAQMLVQAGSMIQKVLNFHLSDAELLRRLSNRRSCPQCQTVYNLIFKPPKEKGVCDRCKSFLVQRSDDEPQTIQKRLGVYRKDTAPLIPYYETQGILENIDAAGAVEDIYSRVLSAVRE
jgi:adenylate kinase